MQICLKIGHPQFRISSFSPVNCNIGIHHISGQSQINVMLMLQFINCIHIPLISPNIHINWFVLIVSSPNPPKLITRQKNKCDHTFFRKLNKNHQSISPIPVVWIEISTPTCQLGLLQAASISPDPSLTRSNPLVLERSWPFGSPARR